MKYRIDRLLGNINDEGAACFCPYPDHIDGAYFGHPDGTPTCCDNPLARRVEAGEIKWRDANRMARTETIPAHILEEFSDYDKGIA